MNPLDLQAELDRRLAELVATASRRRETLAAQRDAFARNRSAGLKLRHQQKEKIMTTTPTRPRRVHDAEIDRVRRTASLEDIARERISLEPAGDNGLQGICPFHSEDDEPLFTVALDRNVFYCNGCGEGGDVINFVQRIDNLTFVEAVERLAEMYSMTLLYVEGPAPVRPPLTVEREIVAARSLSCQGLAQVDADALTFYGLPLAGYAEEMARRGADHVYGCEPIGHGLPDDKPVIFALMSNTRVKRNCALCGVEYRPDEVDAYTEEGPICFSCTKQNAPDLANALEEYGREYCFADDAHEMTRRLFDQLVLHFANGADAKQVQEAAQLVACARNTCGGPNLGHEHIDF